MPYAPPANVHFCVLDDEIYFLDAERGTYSRLSGALANAFSVAIEGKESVDQSDINALSSRGLISYSTLPYKRPNEIPTPVRTLERAKPRPWLSGLPLLPHYALAIRRTQKLPFSEIVRSLAARPLEQYRPSCDQDKAMQIAISGLAIADCIVDRTGKCLPRSMAIWILLRRRHVDAALILGVKAYPFEAHAWVQRGSTVIGDEVDTVRPFSPIFVL